MTMDLILRFAVFSALLCEVVFGIVPPPSNLSIVCHNFENVLYWNYSYPTDQTVFKVTVHPYVGDPQTAETSQTHLNISSYSSDATDNFVVNVIARVGQEESAKISIEFTYSDDFFDERKHKYACSLDFPAVHASANKDMIAVSFKHPSLFYDQSFQEDEFTYTVTHDEIKSSYSCFEDEDEDRLCYVNIHVNESSFGQCIELKFEGKIAAIPSHTHTNVCLPLIQPPNGGFEKLITAIIGGGIVIIFIIVGVVWLLCKKRLEIPNFPKSLHNIMSGQCHTTLPYEQTDVSPVSPVGHTPLLTDPKEQVCVDLSSSPAPEDKDISKTSSSFFPTEVDESAMTEDQEDFGSSSGFGKPSDYDSPKCLLEMDTGDFTEGYGPRPPILPVESKSVME